MSKKTQIKLAVEIGVCPVHMSHVRNGDANLSSGKARKIGTMTDSDPMIWMDGASKQDIKKRSEAIVFWTHS